MKIGSVDFKTFAIQPRKQQQQTHFSKSKKKLSKNYVYSRNIDDTQHKNPFHAKCRSNSCKYFFLTVFLMHGFLWL